MQAEQQQLAVDVIKAAPPIAVTAAEAGGLNVSDVALWLTVIYTALMITQHIWKHWWVPIRDERRRNRNRRRRRARDTEEDDEP